MSVEVSNLYKYFGQQAALDNVSFTASKGQITGFLGPNGAGKTTTMKIIASNLKSDGGSVKVAGFDVDESPLEVRRKVGYLTEHNALYYDMYVREYLSFTAGVYKLTNKKQVVEDIIERTGLGRECHKQIGMLSKGYKQRVGLAQAMIHDPEVLILDEPTSGLDPNQLVEIRKLIKDLGAAKTVIFSTHIMQEVQALCDKVVIIDRGKIVADRPIDELRSLLSEERVLRITLRDAMNLNDLKSIQDVLTVKGAGTDWTVTFNKTSDVRAEVFKEIVVRSGVILEMYVDQSSVEDVFQTVTR